MQGFRRTACWLFTFAMLLFHLGGLAEEPVPIPTLDPNALPYNADEPENLSPEQLWSWSAILIEARSGEVIFEKEADEFRFPASTTKIMTALVALTVLGEEGLNGTAVCSETALSALDGEENVTRLKLEVGEEVNVRELLCATLVYSGNDGACVIAEHVAGSIPAFVDLMNEYARMYGCYNTHFSNPHGLHDDDHYSTARDMAIITNMAMQNETFRDMVNTRTAVISATNKHRERSYNTTNELYNPGTSEKANRFYFPDAIGVKTGFTNRAQYCFVGAAERDGVELISVVMYAGKDSRWGDTIRLMNYGFAQYVSVSPMDLYAANRIERATSGYSLNDTQRGALTLSLVPTDQAAANARIVATKDAVEDMKANFRSIAMIDYSKDFVAPIMAGEVMGTVSWVMDNGQTVTYNLVADRTVPERENLPPTIEEIEARTNADTNPFPPLSVELVLEVLAILAATVGLYFLIRFLLFGRKRHGKGPKIKHRYLR